MTAGELEMSEGFAAYWRAMVALADARAESQRNCAPPGFVPAAPAPTPPVTPNYSVWAAAEPVFDLPEAAN